MTEQTDTLLDRIGNTPLVALDRIRPKDCARIFVKLESENPTGSMKDRMALAMIEAAEKDGRLKPGGHVVEYTAGSTGVSLAFICAVKGYKLTIVTSDAFSSEKRNHMAALGAEMVLVQSDSGGMDASLTRNMMDKAHAIAARTEGFLVNQLANADQIPAYHQMANEIWKQTKGQLNAFVHITGTTASVRGVSEGLRKHNPDVHCIAVEPSESPVLSGGEPGSHGIEGVGAGFVVPLWKPEVIDEVWTVSTDAAMQMARHLSQTEALFCGTSTGGNVASAIKFGRRLGPDGTVVTIMCDTGMKYLSTRLYNN